MPKVLFVCWGNGNRSPMAEGFYNHLTKSSDGSSAGVDPLAPINNIHPTLQAIIVMKEVGIDISKYKGKTITEGMVKNNDLIVVLCEKKVAPLYLLNSRKALFWEVEDPWGSEGLDGFRQARELIKNKVLQIINTDLNTLKSSSQC